MALGEAFTVLAVLEATDKMSRVLEKVDGSLGRFSETAQKAAASATEAGAKIDESLLQTASGADAVKVADARLEAAQTKLSAATKAQADAERALLEAQAAGRNGTEDAVAVDAKMTAAADALTEAQKRAAKASAEVSAAQDRQDAVTRATAAASVTAAGETDAAAVATGRLGKASEEAGAKSGLASKALKYGSLAIAAIGYESIKAAGNFESMTQHLVTDAGESQSSLAMIRSGMLQIATTTGTTTEQMAQGMYHIESAGFHGKAALDVLKVAAEGAKVGGADLDTIGQALTGTMNAFSKEGLSSTQMMNGLIATVGQGDMKLQDLGGSMGNVAAIGASAGLKFSQVAGAIATMTAQNVTAQRATQDLAHTIGSLGNPSKVMTTEMAAMGLNANNVAKNLGKRGLTGTIDVLVQAIAANTKGGDVFVQALNKSKLAATQANEALAQMPASMKKMAESWQNGTTSTKDFNKAIQALPPAQQTLYTQFESLVKKSGSFTDALKANNPTAQTFNAALAKMTGGTTSLNTILMLSGAHSQTFKDNVDKIQGSVSKSGSSVDNWSKIQQTFNQKMDVAKASVEAAGVSIGTALLPAVSAIASVVAKVVAPMATWISQHQKIVGLIASVAAGILIGVGALKAWAAIQGVINALMLVFDAEAAATGIPLLVVAIAALVAGLIYAYTHFKAFRDVVNTVFQVIKTVVMTYIHLVIDYFKLWIAAAELVWKGLQAAWNGVVAGVQWLWGIIQGVWNTIVSVTTTIWNGISGFFEKWWPLLLLIFATPIAIIVGLWNHTHQAIFDTAKTVWHAISGFFVGIWHAIESAAQTAWNLVKQWIITPLQNAWATIQPLLHAVASFLSGVWNNIVSAAQGAWSLVKHWVIQPLLDAWNWLTGWIGKFSDIGSGIISGIINGITSGWNWLMSQVSNLANDALNAAKSVLGINSPSKAFADTVGKAIPEGIAKGINDHAHLAHRAIRGLSTSLTAAASASLSGSFTASLAGGGLPALAGASGGISINIDLRGSTVSSDADRKNLAREIGNEVVKQVARAGIKARAF